MGDLDYEIIYTKEDITESSKLLSPTRKSTGRHYRSVSYGSFLPTFTVDVELLKQLLPAEQKTNENVKENPETRDIKKPERRKHSRVDSVIDSNLLVRTSSENFLTALKVQLNSLFDFVLFHMTQVKEELIRFEHTRATLPPPVPQECGGLVSKSKDAVSINSDPQEEMDSVSVGGDSGIEDDHLGSAKGFFTRIREVCLSMKQSIDTSMSELDRLVGIYDQRMEVEAAKHLLDDHQTKGMELKNQIDGYISDINTKLDSYTNTNDNKNKILEYQSLQRAKKDRFKCLDIFGFLVLLFSSASIVYFSVASPNSRWTILLRLLRSPMMVVGYIYLLGFNMMIWARSGINYISIFDFPRRSIPIPSYMFTVGNVFSGLFALMIAVCLSVGTDGLFISDKVTSFLMWMTILIFWINPFNILNRLGRFSFLLVFVRVLIAPFPIVLFADFWFADQLNSLLALLLDIQYLFCYSLSLDSWHSDELKLKSCTMVSNGIRPIISCLPALWRLLQCLRCYQKTRKIAHLFNAVKYFTTFPVVVFATCFAINSTSVQSFRHLNLEKTGWMIIAWLISSLVHALYCFFWDVVMDWGLFRVCNGCFIFRPTLLYRKWSYVFAVIFDFFIRFACVIKLTLAIVYHIDSDVIYSLLILSEILRRVLWNFFRIEYEQVLRSTNN